VLKHKSGKENKVANVLSKRALMLATMKNEMIGFKKIKYLYEYNKEFRKIVDVQEPNDARQKCTVRILHLGWIFVQGEAVIYIKEINAWEFDQIIAQRGIRTLSMQ
jgi:hypothetical protein